MREGVRAGLVAGLLSGAPSTIHALTTGRDILGPTAAIGTLVLAEDADRTVQLAAAVPLHLGISAGWGVVLAALLPRQGRVLWGALAGAGIALFDLKVVGRRYPRIAELPFGPQLADHLAFGAIVGVLTRPRGRT